MKKIIITGAPGTGKTTLINHLKEAGFNVFNEVSRRVIVLEQEKGGDKTPWQDVLGFSELVYKEIVEELKQKTDAVSFVDRGLPDIIAYLKLHKKEINSNLVNFDYKKHYHSKVFFLPIWKEIYVQDKQRLQTFTEAKVIEELLLETYRDLGFEVMILPKTNSIKRVEIILLNILNKKY